MSQTSEWDAVIGRLEKLERQNRLAKLMGAAILFLAAALVLMGQAAPKQTVEANEFVLKDSNGRVRGRWSVEQGTIFPDVEYSMLSLTDANDKRGISLEMGSGPAMLFNNVNGKGQVSLVLSS